MSATKKRMLDEASGNPKAKKPRKDDGGKKAKGGGEKNHATAVVSEELDFPRGGGTSFTPLEVKTIRAEAVREANEELFEVSFYTAVP